MAAQVGSAVILCLVPHPAGPGPSREICFRLLEEAIKRTPDTAGATGATLIVRLVQLSDDSNALVNIQECRSRAEEIALYNEIHNLAICHERHALDMVVVPFYPASRIQDDAESSSTFVEHSSHRGIRPAVGLPACDFAFGLKRFEKLVPEGTSFIPLDTHPAVAPYLDDSDFVSYEDQFRELPTHNLVAIGGTFDNLHAGHKRLLSAAARVCVGTLTVGVTSDKYLAQKNKRFGEMIEPIDVRLARVKQFLARINPDLSVDAVSIDDGAGPTITRPEIEAIIASTETLKGCRWINEKRREKGWAPLQIITVARTDESNLSSTAIRKWKFEKTQRNLANTGLEGASGEDSKM